MRPTSSARNCRQQLRLVSTVALPFSRGATLAGDHLVVSGHRDVVSVDLRKPLRPRVVSRLKVRGEVFTRAVQIGDRLFVPENQREPGVCALHVIDLARPAKLRRIARFVAPQRQVWGATTVDGRLVLACNDGLEVWDVPAAGAPVLRQKLFAGQHVKQVEAGQGGTYALFWHSARTRLAWLRWTGSGLTPVRRFAKDLVLSDDRLYVAAGHVFLTFNAVHDDDTFALIDRSLTRVKLRSKVSLNPTLITALGSRVVVFDHQAACFRFNPGLTRLTRLFQQFRGTRGAAYIEAPTLSDVTPDGEPAKGIIQIVHYEDLVLALSDTQLAVYRPCAGSMFVSRRLGDGYRPAGR